ncbi:hypothetical protein F5Y17DRAFT_171657 [Xylariaceae sp. FL0594]|nr:hypothetical protein F5Y17DRAFT_171657 [Xylariaceae sp. FL0594]
MKKNHNIPTGSRVGAAESAKGDGNASKSSNGPPPSSGRGRPSIPSNSGAATADTADMSWAKNYPITHLPDRLLPKEQRRPLGLTDKVAYRRLKRIWNPGKQIRDENGAAASSPSQSQDHQTVLRQDGQYCISHDSRPSSEGHRAYGPAPQTTSRRKIPRSKFSSQSPVIRQRAGLQPAAEIEHRGILASSQAPSPADSSDRWTVEIGLDHRHQRDRELATPLYINTTEASLPEMTFDPSPTTGQASPVTPVTEGDRDLLPRKLRRSGKAVKHVCPIPSCGRPLISSADMKRNLCADCRRIFSGPYGDTGIIETTTGGAWNGDDISIDRPDPTPLRRVSGYTNQDKVGGRYGNQRLSGPLLEAKTFDPSTLQGINRNEGSFCQRRLSTIGNNENHRRTFSLPRAGIGIKEHSQARHNLTGGHLDPGPPLKPVANRTTKRREARQVEGEDKHEKFDDWIDELIDSYMWRPDTTDSENESRKVAALALYHVETPEEVKKNCMNWI